MKDLGINKKVTLRNISPNLKGQIIYTLPSQLSDKPLEIAEMHSTSTVEDHNHNQQLTKNMDQCSSPTFATDISSLHSYKFKQKENKSNLINRSEKRDSLNKVKDPQNLLHESRLLKGANIKLGERNTQLEQQNKYLKEMLQESRKLLKNKIQDFGFLKFFEVKNSSQDRDHIDIFLQLQYLKNLTTQKSNRVKELQNIICTLQKQSQEFQIFESQKQLQFKEEVKKFSAIIDKLNAKNQSMKEQLKIKTSQIKPQLEYQYNQLKTLFDQIQKQRQNLSKRNKQLEEEIKIKSSRLDQSNAQYDQLQKQYQQVNLQNEKNKQILRKTERKFQNSCKDKQKLIQQISEQKDVQSCLTKENESLREHNHKLNKQIIKLNNDLKILQIQCQKKQYDSRRERTEMEQQRNLRNIINQKSMQLQQSKSQIQSLKLQLDQEISRANSEKQEKQKVKKGFEELQQEYRKTNYSWQAATQKLQIQLNNKTEQQSDFKRKIFELQNQVNQLRRTRQEALKTSKYAFQNQSTHWHESRVQQSYSSNKSQHRINMKLKEILKQLRECLGKSDPYRSKKMGSQEQLEYCINEITNLINSLIILYQKQIKQTQVFREKYENLQRDRQCILEDKIFEINLKEEAIKKCILFIPQETTSLISQYLFLIQQMIANYPIDNHQKKIQLIELISEQAYEYKNRIKHLQETQKKYNEMKSQYDHLKRVLNNNDTRRNESSEINKREIIKKYFPC